MDDPRTFIISYATRRSATQAADELCARGGSFAAAGSPEENGEWAVYATGPMLRAQVEQSCRLLRAGRFGEPVSW